MKDQWYGDARDLVKWGVLLYLANAYSTKRILQVAYFRPSKWNRINIDGQEHHIPQSVVTHFRSLHNIEKLSSELQIEVLDSLFDNRDTYLKNIAEAIGGQHPCIVFLDPDTGLQPPSSSPKFDHVLDSELKYIWDKILVSDVLVFYQHQTNRNGQDWIIPKRKQFEDALGLPYGSAKVAYGPKIASDVAFYYCRKETAG
jgi:hypothetical protein